MSDTPVPQQVPQQLVDMIVEDYQQQNDDAMGNLHNRFVAYIAEAQVPLTHVITVLTILLSEATELARKKYQG